MSRWTQPIIWMVERVLAALPRMALHFTRWLYFWGLVARSYMVRRGVVSRKRSAKGRAPVPAAPAARPVRYPVTAVSRA